MMAKVLDYELAKKLALRISDEDVIELAIELKDLIEGQEFEKVGEVRSLIADKLTDTCPRCHRKFK